MPYTIEEIKAIVAPIAKKHNLKAVWLFGSYARGEATDKSDVDLVVDTDGADLSGLFAFWGIYADFEEAFGEDGFDCITERTLHQPPQMPSDIHFREAVFRERVKIYDAAA